MDMNTPDHMDIASRNERLYDYLKSMGLFVTPVCRNGAAGPTITHLIVSASSEIAITDENAPKAPRLTPG